MSMMIPFGFGRVRIVFPSGIACDFNVDLDAWREETEVRDRFINMNGDIDSEVKGYYFKFKLPMTDVSLKESTGRQLNIMRYLYQYSRNTTPDKRIKIYPAFSNDLIGSYAEEDAFFTVIHSRPPKFKNIGKKKKSGQIMTLNLETINMTLPSQYQSIFYRNITGAWGSLGRGTKKIYIPAVVTPGTGGLK